MSIARIVLDRSVVRDVPKEVLSIKTVHSNPSTRMLRYAIEAGKKKYEEHQDEILIARNVPIFLNLGFSACQLLLLHNGDLFVRKVPGEVHSMVQGHVSGVLYAGLRDDGIHLEVTVLMVTWGNYRGTGAEPDVSLLSGCPTLERAAPNRTQILVEVEHSHRSMRYARIMANLYFQNSDARGVAVIKI